MIQSLSSFEMQFVSDPDVLLLKNKIIQHVMEMFGQLSEDYKLIFSKWEDVEKINNAKISRGENYRGLPYLILDYPRQFGKPDVFAIRSFFWWGHFFSITLHLEGEYFHRYAPLLTNAIESNSLASWHIASSSNRWDHHFDEENYTPVTEGRNIIIKDLPFLKLAKKNPLIKWDEVYTFFNENFSLLIKVLSDQAPIL